MAEVQVTEEVKASADRVWELVRDFGDIAKWAGAGIQSCEVEGEGVGAIRTLGVGAGAPIRERLESHDDEKRSFQYSILDGPLPVADYLATFQVNETGPDRCKIEWGSRFEPAGLPEEQVQGILRGVYEGGIRAIKSALE